MKIILFIISFFSEYNFSPSILSGTKFNLEGKAISILHAPSLFKENKKILLSFSYSNPYSISGFNFLEGAFMKQEGDFGAGGGYKYMGFDFYKEISYVFGIFFKRENLNAGFNLKYLYLYIKDTFSRGSFSLDLGISFCPFKNIKIGVFFLNLNSPVLHEEKIFPSGSLSFSLKENESLETFFDINYEDKFTSFSFAQKIMLMKNITLCAGISNQPPLFSLSLELNLDKINFIYSFKNHPILGGYNAYEVDFSG